MGRGFLYSRGVEVPFVPPSIAPSFGWSQELSLPYRRNQRPVPENPQPALTPQTPVPFVSIGWLEPWEQPPHRNFRPVPENPPLGLGEAPPVATVPSTGWLVAWEPAPRRGPRLWITAPVDVAFVPAPFISMGWLESWEQPGARHRVDQGLFAGVFPPALAPYGWFEPWGQPHRRKRVDHGFTADVAFVPAPFPSFGWFEPWGQPHRRKRIVDQGFAADVAFVPAPFPSFGWFEPWEQPQQRRTPLLRMPLGDVVLLPAVLAPNYGWFQGLSLPYRRNQRPIPENPAFALTPEPPPPFVSPNYGWFQGLSLPYRRNQRPIPENPAFALGVGAPFVYAPSLSTLLAWAAERMLTAASPIRLRVAWSPQRNRTASFTPNRTMSQAATLEPPIDPGEQETIGFDFGPAGVTLQNVQPTVTVTVSRVSQVQDPSAQSRLASSVQTLVPSKKTGAPNAQWNVLFGPPVPGVTYVLQCLALSVDGQTLSIWVRFQADQPQ